MVIYCPPGYRRITLTCSVCGHTFDVACPADDADQLDADGGELEAVCNDCDSPDDECDD